MTARKQSDWTAARGHAIEEVELRRALVASASAEVRDLDGLADALLGLASADEKLGEHAAALVWREESVAVLRDALARSDEVGLQRTLVFALEGLAAVYDTLHDATAGNAAAAGAVETAEGMVNQDPSLRHLRMLGHALRLLAARQEHDRDWQQATWERSVSVLQQALELHDDDEERRTLAEVLIAAAADATEAGRTELSVDLAARAAATVEELAPGPTTHLLRAHALLTIADATAARSRHDATAFRAALAAIEPIEDRVVEMDGASVLLGILYGLAVAAEEDGDRAGAMAWIERYLAVGKQTVAHLERVGEIGPAQQLRQGLAQARQATRAGPASALATHWPDYRPPPIEPPDAN